MNSARRTALAALCLAAVLPLAAACGDGNPDPNASTQPPGDGTLGTGTATTPAPPPAEYPNSPLAYAHAVLEAWAPPGDVDRLGDLSTPQVQEQLMEVVGVADFNWHDKECRSVLPNWECVFFNDHGDRQTIMISDSLLGEAHAAVQVALDLTEYPGNAVAYAREFADAWRDGNIFRMRRLAEDSLAEELDGLTEPAAGYRACGDGAAGSTYVRIYGAGGPEYVLQVVNQYLGDSDAISSRVTPVPNPPACQQIILNPTIINPSIIFTQGG